MRRPHTTALAVLLPLAGCLGDATTIEPGARALSDGSTYRATFESELRVHLADGSVYPVRATTSGILAVPSAGGAASLRPCVLSLRSLHNFVPVVLTIDAGAFADLPRSNFGLGDGALGAFEVALGRGGRDDDGDGEPGVHVRADFPVPWLEDPQGNLVLTQSFGPTAVQSAPDGTLVGTVRSSAFEIAAAGEPDAIAVAVSANHLMTASAFAQLVGAMAPRTETVGATLQAVPVGPSATCYSDQ